MNKRYCIRVLAAIAAAGVCAPVLSHHSHSMFDHSREVAITGTVSEFLFNNPHVYLYLDVEREGGEVVNYWVEMSNIQNMIRRGIGLRTFQPGDVVTVHVYPLKDGRPGGNYSWIVAADGTAYD